MSSRYDRAITVFSPDGHLFQVDYAQEAVKKGTNAVAATCADAVVVGVERRSTAKLQEERTARKIISLDDHVFLAFAGLTADARVLYDRARIECQSHKLTVEDPVSLEYITRYIATTKQKFTQSGGVRPYGISDIIAGFDDDGSVKLYVTDPSGVYHQWNAAAIGRSSKTLKEFLEKNWKDDLTTDHTIKLVIKTLLETVQSGSKNMEVAIMKKNQKLEMLSEELVTKVIEEVEAEKEAEAASKKKTLDK